MRKIIFILFGLVIVTGFLLPIEFVKEASAEGPSIDIHIPLPLPPPPPRIFIKPPEIIVIPGSPVFVAPHPDVDIFFYDDYWWSPRGDRWYRSRDYNGHWKEMDGRHLPDFVRHAPRNYRTVYKHEHRIPYGQWKKQRNHGEKVKYKKKAESKHEERREDRREEQKQDKHGRGHK